MPVIAQIILPIKFEEGTVEILRERFNQSECGCLNLVTEGKRLNMPVEAVRMAVYGIDNVTCKGDNCCMSDVQSFSAKLKRFLRE